MSWMNKGNPRELAPPNVLNAREVYLQAIRELAEPFPSTPLKDWQEFNKILGGFRAREFSILCGATGVGKTQFLANISAQLLKQKEKHFVMSVETGHTDFMKRVMSVLCGQDLNTGEAHSPESLSRIHTRYAEFLEADTIEFSLYENRLSVDQLMHDITMMVEKGCKIAMIDNLNFFMEVTRAADQVVEMDRVIHELIIFCKQIDVHIIMVMHPKKTLNGRVENEFDIKGSSTAVQEAHNIFLLNRPKIEDIENKPITRDYRELKIQKMRRRGRYVGQSFLFEGVGTRYVERGISDGR